MAKENALWVKPKHDNTDSVYQRIEVTENFETEKEDTLFKDIKVVETFEDKNMVLLMNGTYVYARVGDYLITKSPNSISLIQPNAAQNYVPVFIKK